MITIEMTQEPDIQKERTEKRKSDTKWWGITNEAINERLQELSSRINPDDFDDDTYTKQYLQQGKTFTDYINDIQQNKVPKKQQRHDTYINEPQKKKSPSITKHPRKRRSGRVNALEIMEILIQQHHQPPSFEVISGSINHILNGMEGKELREWYAWYSSKTTLRGHVILKRGRRLQPNPKLVDVLLSVVENPFMWSKRISNDVGLTQRQTSRILRQLYEKRWIVREYDTYKLNPFFEMLAKIHPDYYQLINLLPLKVDLIDVLCIPLFDALKFPVTNVEFLWSFQLPDFGQPFPQMVHGHGLPELRPYFNGLLQMKIMTEKLPYYVVLPFNVHWTGRNYHLCLPIPWAFFGIDEAQYAKDELKVHWDTSITTMIPLGSASDTTRKNRHKHGMKHWIDDFNKWMNKYWKNEYVETWDFPTMEEIIRRRLIEKKWRPVEDTIGGSLSLAENITGAYERD